jgi:hypothetical protein
MRRSVGKIVAATGSGAVSFRRAITHTVSGSAIGTVTITRLSLIVQATRRALYLRGTSFWKGRS